MDLTLVNNFTSDDNNNMKDKDYFVLNFTGSDSDDSVYLLSLLEKLILNVFKGVDLKLDEDEILLKENIERKTESKDNKETIIYIVEILKHFKEQ